jgi:hypothetical protein
MEKAFQLNRNASTKKIGSNISCSKLQQFPQQVACFLVSGIFF